MAIVVDSPAIGIMRIRLDRPAARNAIDDATRVALLDAMTSARFDDAVRSIVIGGTNGVFSAGGDLPSLAGLSYDAAYARLRSGHLVVSAIWECPKPVIIAAENLAVGAAAGIALAADIIVAGPSTRFAFPFLKLGLVPDWGIARSLKSRTGEAISGRLLRDSATIQGEEAANLGIVDKLVADELVMDAAVQSAIAEAAKAGHAFGQLKRMMRGEADIALNLLAEAKAQACCVISPEFAEGYAAFRAKRQPRFV